MRRRIASVTNETEGGLTTLERVKLELGISGSASDQLLRIKIREATSDIEQRIRPIRFATIVEEFWPLFSDASLSLPSKTPFVRVSRYPNVTVTSIVVDGQTLGGPTTYRVNSESGQIDLLDGSGTIDQWQIANLAVVTYSGGYLFPEDTGDSLPPVLESAAVEMITMFWMARGRDPLLKAEENPGVARFEYWVGAIGSAGDLPPSIQGKLSGFLKEPVFA